MAISFPLTPPSSPSFASFALRQINVVGKTTSQITLQRQTQVFIGQAWEVIASLPVMTRVEAAPWIAFFSSLEGIRGSVVIGDPLAATPLGIGTGTPLVDGASQTGQTLNTKGWTVSQTGILKAGDYLQLGTGGGSQLHLVLTDANSDGAGLAAFDLWPRLRSSPIDGATIFVNNTVGVFALDTNLFEWEEISPSLYAPIAFSLKEIVS